MMTTVGRGRGNWGSKDLPAPLRRPGEASRASGGEEDIILREIENLDINDHRKFEVVESQIKKYCVNREHLWKICQKMYESSAKDRNMVQKVVKFWKNLSCFEVNDVKLRSVLMSTAQKDFEERDDIRKDDHDRYLNAIAIFGGIFHNMTLPGGGVFVVLVIPMIEYLTLLINEASKDKKQREAELELFANQLSLNGSALMEHAKESMEELSIIVRNSLTTAQPTSKCYYLLLLVLDLSSHSWSPRDFPSFLKTFYIDKLGDTFNHLATSEITRWPVKTIPMNPPNKIITEGSSSATIKNDIRSPTESNFQKKDFSTDRTNKWNENKFQNKDFSTDKTNKWNGQNYSGDYKERRKPHYYGHDERFEGDSGADHRSPEKGGRGGGGDGGWANWKGRGDNRSHKNYEDRNKWNNKSQSENKHNVTSAEEERWD